MPRLSGDLRPFRRIAAAICAMAGLAASPGSAAPLEKDACESLKAEQSKLAATGLRSDMQRGAQWGKSNLSAERLSQVARLIEIDEQILFRCPAPPDPAVQARPAKPVKPDRDAVAADDESKSEMKPQAASVAPAAAPKPRKPTQKAAKPSVSSAATAEAADKPPPAKKRAAAKTKSDDAFQPPAGAPQSVLKPPPTVE